MKISGIICEYNPFHNGHFHHITQTRKNGATHIVAVMSGNFVQRGDVAIIDKFERAKTAVRCGADLVIELPVSYSLGAAEVFARGAVSLLSSLGCVDELSFGSECGDLQLLRTAVTASKDCAERPELEELLRLGNSYPRALQILIRQTYGDRISALFDTANNVLAIEYLKAMADSDSSMQPFTVKRYVPHDGETVKDELASASLIRQMLAEGSKAYEKLIPPPSAASIRHCADAGAIARFIHLERILLYRLRTASPEEMTASPEVAHGLEHKILAARNETSLDDMLMAMKSKRYPMARLRRILLHTLLGIRTEHIMTPPPYARILALNDRGTEILNAVKKRKPTFPCGTSLAKLGEVNETCKTFAALEANATAVYGLAQGKIAPADADYRAKIGIVKD